MWNLTSMSALRAPELASITRGIAAMAMKNMRPGFVVLDWLESAHEKAEEFGYRSVQTDVRTVREAFEAGSPIAPSALRDLVNLCALAFDLHCREYARVLQEGLATRPERAKAADVLGANDERDSEERGVADLQ